MSGGVQGLSSKIHIPQSCLADIKACTQRSKESRSSLETRRQLVPSAPTKVQVHTLAELQCTQTHSSRQAGASPHLLQMLHCLRPTHEGP